MTDSISFLFQTRRGRFPAVGTTWALYGHLKGAWQGTLCVWKCDFTNLVLPARTIKRWGVEPPSHTASALDLSWEAGLTQKYFQ